TGDSQRSAEVCSAAGRESAASCHAPRTACEPNRYGSFDELRSDAAHSPRCTSWRAPRRATAHLPLPNRRPEPCWAEKRVPRLQPEPPVLGDNCPAAAASTSRNELERRPWRRAHSKMDRQRRGTAASEGCSP